LINNESSCAATKNLVFIKIINQSNTNHSDPLKAEWGNKFLNALDQPEPPFTRLIVVINKNSDDVFINKLPIFDR